MWAWGFFEKGEHNMKCPFCGKEMAAGTLTCSDGRGKIIWEAADKKLSFLDKLGGKGALKCWEFHPFSGYTIKADYCPSCKKMIFDTEITP